MARLRYSRTPTFSAVSISRYLQAALIEAHQRYPSLQRKWIDTLTRLLAYHGATGLLRYQSDYRMDLIIRAMEDETVDGLRSPPSDADFAADVQLMLSRYWVLSTYEALRIAKDSSAGKPNARIQSLYERFRLVRVPTAKLEIANDRHLGAPATLTSIGEGADTAPLVYSSKAKCEYHPPVIVDTTSGSIGWILIEAKSRSQITIFRRQLSDEVLAIFD